MKTFIRKASERGTADFGWLKPNYYFSFSHYHDPKHINFGALRVLNDDFIAGGGGFPNHPHDNMEIITIPLSGAIQHRDSTGGQGIINAGDVQIMSAGTGVFHSEFNHEKERETHLLQIWILPKVKEITPRYDQKSFTENFKNSDFVLVVSGSGRDESIQINQDAEIFSAKFSAGKDFEFTPNPKCKIWIQMISGKILVNGKAIETGDAVAVQDEKEIKIIAEENSEFLFFDL